MKTKKYKMIAMMLAAAVSFGQAGTAVAYAEAAVSEAAVTEAVLSESAVSEEVKSETAESEATSSKEANSEAAASDKSTSEEQENALNPESIEEDPESDGSVQLSRVRFAKDYKEVFEALQSAAPYWYYYEDVDYAMAEDDVIAPAMANSSQADTMRTESASDTGTYATGGDYSETNVRTEGVDESDVVKTDGTYLYILRHRKDLAIVKAEGQKLEKQAEIHLYDADTAGNGYTEAHEFFVQGKRLYVIIEGSAETTTGNRYGTAARVTKVVTYDLTDPTSPVKTGEMEQDGSFHQARMKDGCLYLFTEWMPILGSSAEDSEMIVHAGKEEITPDRICIPSIITDANYLVISSIRAEHPSKVCDSKVLISGAQKLYVSSGGIFAVNVDYRQAREKTEITKFTYSDGKIEGKAAGSVRGSVNDTFSIDEYDGYLRVLTTYTGSIRGNFLELLSELFGFDYYDDDQWTRHNALFVLDESLHPVSRITDLAKGEEIRSARYFGDKAYFVTFRNTDPLFTVDLSDPKAPKITDELKIPGFSQYLHPFGENKLLGLGYDADETTGGITGIKISLFDISGEEVLETDRTVISNITYLPVLNEYKAIFANADRGLVGFYLDDRYLVYRHMENGGFERVLLYDFFEDSLQGSMSYQDVRGLYIGSTFYIAGGDAVAAFDMDDNFTKTALLRL